MTRLAARSSALRARVLQGLPVDLAAIDELVRRARHHGEVQFIIHSIHTASLALLRAGSPAAKALLVELSEVREVELELLLIHAVPELVRTALACRDQALAERFAGMVVPFTPEHRHVLAGAAAALAEARGDGGAAAAYAGAARGWSDFGEAGEHAQALLGQARCTADPAEAGALFTQLQPILVSLGAAPLLSVVAKR